MIAANDLRVAIDDRVFEHGLGLFETFRTWDGRACLLGRHLERLRTSARVLGIGLEGVRLPDHGAITALLATVGLGGDVLLRITMTAGSSGGRPPVAWLAASALPAPESLPLSALVDEHGLGSDSASVHPHKMLNYWGRRRAFERAQAQGCDDMLLTSDGGWLREGSRNNILIVPAGRPRVVATPGLEGPILPGIMRRVALDFALAHGLAIEERPVPIGELFGAEAVFLTNSVRGVRPVGWVNQVAVGSSDQQEIIRLFSDELPRHIRSIPDPAGPLP